MDLRTKRTKKLIMDTFKTMICEMDISKITVRELTDRAMISRKTFYLHFETIDMLVNEILNEISDKYSREYKALPEGRPHEEANALFFRFFSSQSEYVQKILCYPPYVELCNKIFDKAFYDNIKPGSVFDRIPEHVRSLVLTYYRSTTLDLYRQWVKDHRKLSLEEIIEISNCMICRGSDHIEEAVSKYLQ